MKFNKQRITDLRVQLGLSVYAFAKRLGTSSQRVQQWEDGQTQPNLDGISSMCREFMVEPGYFFD